jgi:SAM-dependent methyltransferase
MPVEHYSEQLIRKSGFADERFPGGYDANRPSPPQALLDLLCLEAQVERPQLVLDLGSGTGLSTRVWADRADEVVGVEPSEQMRLRAEDMTAASHVRYVQAFADQTGLPEASADIVTCSQSFHWMEPSPTLAEVARILRPGGVFAAYDYDWPPVVHWEVEAAFEELLARVDSSRKDRLGYVNLPDKEGHLERMRASGHFRFTREALVHSRETGNADRIVGLAFSLGPLNVLLEGGMTEDEVGLTQLREVAAKALGEPETNWFLCYRARLGIK